VVSLDHRRRAGEARQGVGQRLLEPTVAEAGIAGAMRYLETFSPRNIKFYERAGFHAIASFLEPTTRAR